MDRRSFLKVVGATIAMASPVAVAVEALTPAPVMPLLFPKMPQFIGAVPLTMYEASIQEIIDIEDAKFLAALDNMGR